MFYAFFCFEFLFKWKIELSMNLQQPWIKTVLMLAILKWNLWFWDTNNAPPGFIFAKHFLFPLSLSLFLPLLQHFSISIPIPLIDFSGRRGCFVRNSGFQFPFTSHAILTVKGHFMHTNHECSHFPRPSGRTHVKIYTIHHRHSTFCARSFIFYFSLSHKVFVFCFVPSAIYITSFWNEWFVREAA